MTEVLSLRDLESSCPGLARSLVGPSGNSQTAGLCSPHRSRHCSMGVAGRWGWGGGQGGRRVSNATPLHDRPRSQLWLYRLRDLFAFQILSWETEAKAAFIKATAGSSSKGAGHGARRRPRSQPPFLCPRVPPCLPPPLY